MSDSCSTVTQPAISVNMISQMDPNILHHRWLFSVPVVGAALGPSFYDFVSNMVSKRYPESVIPSFSQTSRSLTLLKCDKHYKISSLLNLERVPFSCPSLVSLQNTRSVDFGLLINPVGDPLEYLL